MRGGTDGKIQPDSPCQERRNRPRAKIMKTETTNLNRHRPLLPNALTRRYRRLQRGMAAVSELETYDASAEEDWNDRYDHEDYDDGYDDSWNPFDCRAAWDYLLFNNAWNCVLAGAGAGPIEALVSSVSWPELVVTEALGRDRAGQEARPGYSAAELPAALVRHLQRLTEARFRPEACPLKVTAADLAALRSLGIRLASAGRGGEHLVHPGVDVGSSPVRGGNGHAPLRRRLRTSLCERFLQDLLAPPQRRASAHPGTGAGHHYDHAGSWGVQPSG